MAQIALITDTHFGVRSDSGVVQEWQKKFLDEVFFPTLDKHQITHVLHGGDYGDRRDETQESYGPGMTPERWMVPKASKTAQPTTSCSTPNATTDRASFTAVPGTPTTLPGGSCGKLLQPFDAE